LQNKTKMKPKTHIQEKLKRMSEQQQMLQEKKREIEEKLAEQKRSSLIYEQNGVHNQFDETMKSKHVPLKSPMRFFFSLIFSHK
jgi:hypothetical protein